MVSSTTFMASSTLLRTRIKIEDLVILLCRIYGLKIYFFDCEVRRIDIAAGILHKASHEADQIFLTD